jgi:hypothetical protein
MSMDSRGMEWHRACKAASDPPDPRERWTLSPVESGDAVKRISYADMPEPGKITQEHVVLLPLFRSSPYDPISTQPTSGISHTKPWKRYRLQVAMCYHNCVAPDRGDVHNDNVTLAYVFLHLCDSLPQEESLVTRDGSDIADTRFELCRCLRTSHQFRVYGRIIVASAKRCVDFGDKRLVALG